MPSLSLSLSRFRILNRGFSNRPAAVTAAAARRTRRRYDRPAAPRSNRGARDLISRTRVDDAARYSRIVPERTRTENGAHNDASERTRACLPVCLTPASCLACLACLPACLPRSAANSPRPPRCLSREWPVYMLTLCLRVFRPLPSRAGPRLPPLSRPGTAQFPLLCALSFSFFVSVIDDLVPFSFTSSASFSLSVTTRVFAMPNKARFTLPCR